MSRPRPVLAHALSELGAALERKAERRAQRAAPAPVRRVVPNDMRLSAERLERERDAARAELDAPCCSRCDTPASGKDGRWWCAECGAPVTLPRA